MARKNKKTSEKVDLPLTAFLLPILVGLLIVVTMIFIVRPQVVGIAETREEIETQENQLAKLVDKKEVLEEQSPDRLKEYLSTVNTVIPDSKPVFSFVSGLAGLSALHPQVVIGDYAINPGSLATMSAELESDPGALSQMKTELEIRGEYKGIMDYLADLHRLAPMIGVTSIEVNGTIDPNSTSSQSVTLAMNVDVFYALSPDSIGKVSDPLPQYGGDFETTLSRLQSFETFREANEASYLDVDQQRQNPFSF